MDDSIAVLQGNSYTVRISNITGEYIQTALHITGTVV
jgi:hypothetical protein